MTGPCDVADSSALWAAQSRVENTRIRSADPATIASARRPLKNGVRAPDTKAVHALTHPSAKLERRPTTPGPELVKTASTREELFSLLAAEAGEERLADDGS